MNAQYGYGISLKHNNKGTYFYWLIILYEGSKLAVASSKYATRKSHLPPVKKPG